MLRYIFGLSSKDILFVCASPIDEVWVRSTALRCHSLGLRVGMLICGTREDCPEGTLEVYRSAGIDVDRGVTLDAAAQRKCCLVVTASSGLNRRIFPTKAKAFIHMPHSLASLHMIYPVDAFDGYDVLFAAGPQHTAEFSAIASGRRLSGRRSFAVGYGKLDILAHQGIQRQGRSAKQPLVLLAPSWGGDNLLDRCGVALARSLAAAGFDVTVRPHPLFFLDEAPVLAGLQALQSSVPGIRLESPFAGDDAIFDADVLVGDYSGIGFEFAALRGKPVVSVDVGLKIANPDWQMLPMPPVEISLRQQLGPTVSPNVDDIVAAVRACVTGEQTVADGVAADFLYGRPGECSGRAASQLQELLDNH